MSPSLRKLSVLMRVEKSIQGLSTGDIVFSRCVLNARTFAPFFAYCLVLLANVAVQAQSN